MLRCDKCGFGHKTLEEHQACKSWAEMQAEDTTTKAEVNPPSQAPQECGHRQHQSSQRYKFVCELPHGHAGEHHYRVENLAESGSPSQGGKFTPGPWSCNRDGAFDYRITRIHYAETICKVRCEANAHLIAATPQMYEALKAILYWYEVELKNSNRDIAIEKARAALRTAEGKE